MTASSLSDTLVVSFLASEPALFRDLNLSRIAHCDVGPTLRASAFGRCAARPVGAGQRTGPYLAKGRNGHVIERPINSFLATEDTIMASEAVHHTYCPMCVAQCGVVAVVEDGQLTKIRTDSEHPDGGICIKGSAAPEVVYSTRPIAAADEAHTAQRRP